MQEPMEESIKHAKFYAKYLSHCRVEYVTDLILKETGMTSSQDGFHYSVQCISMMYENPFDKLIDGIYVTIGSRRKPRAAKKTVEKAIHRAIRFAWKRRSIVMWELFFPKGCVGNDKCPANKDYLAGMVDFLRLWKGCCEEVRYAEECV